jgi:hypothetical protein
MDRPTCTISRYVISRYDCVTTMTPPEDNGVTRNDSDDTAPPAEAPPQSAALVRRRNRRRCRRRRYHHRRRPAARVSPTLRPPAPPAHPRLSSYPPTGPRLLSPAVRQPARRAGLFHHARGGPQEGEAAGAADCFAMAPAIDALRASSTARLPEPGPPVLPEEGTDEFTAAGLLGGGPGARAAWPAEVPRRSFAGLGLR